MFVFLKSLINTIILIDLKILLIINMGNLASKKSKICLICNKKYKNEHICSSCFLCKKQCNCLKICPKEIQRENNCKNIKNIEIIIEYYKIAFEEKWIFKIFNLLKII